MEIEEGVEMIQVMYEKQREERHFTLYASIYPKMTKETFIQFEEFHKPQKEIEKSTDTKSAEEILKEVQETMNSHSWR